VNFGILPITFANEADYGALEQGDEWSVTGLRDAIRAGNTITIRNVTKQRDIVFRHNLTPRQVEIVLAGGLLNHIKASEASEASDALHRP
jgi:aconitate hydratase